VQPEALAAPDADADAGADAGDGLTAELQAVEIGTAKFDLTLAAEESRERLVLTWEYCRDLFDRATLRRLAGAYLLVLAEAASAGPERRLDEMQLVTPAERHRRSSNGAGGAVRCPSRRRSMAASPRRCGTAGCGGAPRRRRQCANTANTPSPTASSPALAAPGAPAAAPRRRSRGMRRALATARSPELIVALLAVLASGGAMCARRELPAKRWLRILAETRAPLLLTTAERRGQLPEEVATSGIAHPRRRP